jgi:outer membrane autotransporter protein
MKRIAIAAAAALMMLGTAQAQQQRSPLYGEVGYSFLEVKADGFKANPQALRGIIGYDLHPFVAVEGMVAFGTSSDSDNGVDFKLKNAWGLFVKPKYDFGNIEAFARLGWARTRISGTDAIGTETSSEGDFAWGVGANYRLNPRMSVGLDYSRLRDKDNVKLNGWTVNFGYRF